MMLTCFSPTGKLDSSFGINGRFFSPIMMSMKKLLVGVQSDGKIIAGCDVYVVLISGASIQR